MSFYLNVTVKVNNLLQATWITKLDNCGCAKGNKTKEISMSNTSGKPRWMNTTSNLEFTSQI